MKAYISQFIKYTLYGSGAAVVDLAILWLVWEFFGAHYLIATVLAFIAATLVNYTVFRRFIFNGMQKGFNEGYAYFLAFAAIGMFLTAGGMMLFIEVFELGVFTSRVLTAIVVGIWNFSMNYFLTFRMKRGAAGKADSAGTGTAI